MPRFKYQAVDDSGSVFKGEILAFNEGDMEERLKERGLVLIKSKEIQENKISLPILRGYVKPVVLAEFYQRLSQAIRVGLPMLSSLEESVKMLPSRRLRKIVERIRLSVENGETLHSAMGQFPDVFSKLDLSIIMVGEQSGTLPESLKSLAEFLSWKEEIKSIIKRATIYPCFVMIVIFAVIGVWVGYVLPQLAKVLSEMGMELPHATRFVLSASYFLKANWITIILGLCSVLFLLFLFVKTKKGKLMFHRLLLKIPIISHVVKNIAVARLSHYFSVMMRAGMTMGRIFELTAEGLIGNKFLEKQLKTIYRYIVEGSTIADAFERVESFPALLIGAIRSGESSGTLDEAFERLGEYYDKEAKKSVQIMVSAFEPFMIVFLGVIFGVIALSILLPLYNVISRFGKVY